MKTRPAVGFHPTESNVLIDPRLTIEQSPLSRAQFIAIALVACLSALDGYDLLSITFAAPAIVLDFGISKSLLGMVFASSLVGVGLGSLAIAPIADLVGRRPMVVVNLLVMAIGMVLSAYALSILELATYRVITGIGIGSMIPIILPLASEYANKRRRALAVSVMTIGYPLGGLIGGLAAALLLKWYGWQAVFLLGAGFALVLIPLVLRWLPEPLAFLLTRRDSRTLDRVNDFLSRLGHAPVTDLPSIGEPSVAVPYRVIFGPKQLVPTLYVTLINLLFIITVYFILSWMPQIMVERGFDPSTAASASSLASLAGVFACIAASVVAGRFSSYTFATALMLGLALSTATFGFLPASLPALIGVAVLIGIFLFSGTAALYAIIVDTFPPEIRATGVGFVTGLGRAGAGLAPALAGFLLSAGATIGSVTAIIGSAAGIAGILLMFPRFRLGRTSVTE